jgi:apolipoprotein N-acyltransferase
MNDRIAQLRFWPSLAISATFGWILSTGAPPGGWTPGTFVGLVPLIVMVRRDSVSWRQAAWFGLAGGMGVGLGGFPWIADMLVRFARVPWPMGYLGLALVSLWMALPYAIWAAGLRLGPFNGWRAYVWPLVLFVALQSIWPVLFPYTFLLGFAEQPALMQLAELGGVPLLEALVVLCAVFVARALAVDAAAVRLRLLAIAGLIPLLMYVQGSWRMQSLDAEAAGAPVVRVGIVQPNVPIGPVPGSEKLARLRLPSVEAERRGAELIVWPEAGTFPYRVERPFEHDDSLRAADVMALHGRPTIFGAGSRKRGERYAYNSAYLMDPTGAVQGSYDKIKLVPIGEYIPLIDPAWITDWVPQIAHHHRGEGAVRFIVERPDGAGALPVGPLICYEDIVASMVRDVAALDGGVVMFVNLTIDAWYGDTAEPWEHLALAQFRSVEHRVPLLRSVSSGVSAVVDYAGRRVAHIPLRPVTPENLAQYPAELMVESVKLLRNTADAPTPYASFGWLLAPLCQLGVAAVVVLRWWGARKGIASAIG